MKKVLFLFGELTDLDIDWLIAHGKTEQVREGTVLIQEGKAIDALYIVLEGQFGVSVTGRSGGDFSRMSAGDILGEISFVDSRPPTTTVRAATNSLVFTISRQVLGAKLRQDLGFGSRFHRALAVFLAHRLRVLTLKFAQGPGAAGSPETEAAGELDSDVLAGIYMGGRRFERMVKQLTAN